MARRRILRWLLWSGLAAVGPLAAAVLSTPLWLRPVAEWQASAVLARPVAIGRLRLGPGDPLVLTAEDVVVGNPPGFLAGEEEPFARIPRLTVRLGALASLRRREFVILSLEVERPMVRAIATGDGRDNYHLGPSAGPAGGGAGPPVGTLTMLPRRPRRTECGKGTSQTALQACAGVRADPGLWRRLGRRGVPRPAIAPDGSRDGVGARDLAARWRRDFTSSTMGRARYFAPINLTNLYPQGVDAAEATPPPCCAALDRHDRWRGGVGRGSGFARRGSDHVRKEMS